MRRGLTRQVWFVAGLAIITAIAAFTVLVLTIISLEHATDEARTHERVATDAQRVRALTVDGETAIRGFVITGRDNFLQPLRAAVNELPTVDARLQTRAQSGPERHLAERISSASSSYFDDYALPLLDTARRDRGAAASVVKSEAGKRRLDAIRRDVAALVALADRAAADRQQTAQARGDLARIAAIGAGLILVLVLVLGMRAVQRRVVDPVVEATEAAARIGAGDFTGRLPTGRDDEIGRLAAGINAMAAHLQEGAVELEAQHTELESQNAELEAQSVELEVQASELERRTAELAVSNDHLQTRSEDLEATAQRLATTSDRLRLYAHVAESLAQVPDVERRAQRLLTELADALDCPIGSVYARAGDERADCMLVARRGLAMAPMAAADAGDLVDRALAERRAVVATHPDAALEFETLGGRVPVRHEVHLPLVAGPDRDIVLGVVSLARTADEPFDEDDLAMLHHLVNSSALAFFNAIVSAQRERQASMMRSVLDSVSEAILVVAADGTVVLSNPPMEAFARRLLRVSNDEPWDIPSLQQAMDSEVRSGEDRDRGNDALRRDPLAVDRRTLELPTLGIWVHRYAAPVRHGDQILGRIVVVRDITEERQAERAKDDLMATVSHELRTPLAAILGFTELLATREFPADERQEYIETVYQQSTRLAELLDDFLDLQRIERRGLDRSAPVDLRTVIDEEVKLYSAQSKAHQLTAKLSGQELVVDGDGERLHRVVGNLLSNAIKYSPSGGPVRVEAQREDGHVRVSVVDRGVGIPETARDRVFDRFFRVESGATARIGGTGLGLALVRDIVHAHGGTVGVESVEGQGSRFWLMIPAANYS